jgi:glycosyltransferase involved in cell wall biosynthesis
MSGKRIIICTNAYPPNFIGGAELIAHYQARILKNHGYELVVFSGELNNNGTRYSIRKDTFETITIYRVCLHDRDYSSDYFNFYHPQVEQLFTDLLDKFSPDIVHFHNIIGLSASLPRIAKHRSIKTVLTLHDYWGICFKNTLLKSDNTLCEEISDCGDCKAYIADGTFSGVPIRLRRDFILMQLEYVDTFISPSSFLAERYIKAGLCADKMRVIPNGIDIERFSGIERIDCHDRVRFSFAGYLGKHKGVPTIIEALPLIKNKGKFFINLIGDGEDRVVYQNLINKSGLTDTVKFWGKIDNRRIEDVYRETDVLILPSIWPENQPVSITEAMAARIPVIASRIGGIPELVKDGITGFLFTPGDAVDLAKKMDACIANPDILVELGKNAFSEIRQYTFENQVSKIIKIYEDHPPQRDSSDAGELIICVGENMDPRYTKAINFFIEGNNRHNKFLSLDWLNTAEISRAQLFWVVDNHTTLEQLAGAILHKIALLVPEENSALKNFCVENNCGLYYKDAIEAAVCLEYLTGHHNICGILGNNLYDFFSQKTLLKAAN